MTMLEELTTSLCLEFVFSVCRGCKENVRTLVHYRPKKKVMMMINIKYEEAQMKFK